MPVNVPEGTPEVVLPPLPGTPADVDKGSAEMIPEVELAGLPLVVVFKVLPGTLLLKPLGSRDAASVVAVLAKL